MKRNRVQNKGKGKGPMKDSELEELYNFRFEDNELSDDEEKKDEVSDEEEDENENEATVDPQGYLFSFLSLAFFKLSF
jgi:hypothetical protein